MTQLLLRFTINGELTEVLVEARQTLVDVIRENLELTGTHVGCEHGVCGACTVLVGGLPVRSCLMLAIQAADTEVLTIEGVGTPDALHPLQEALRESLSFQCGFCTPGFVMTALALLTEGRILNEEELREELSSNICRCTGYQSIIEGVQLAFQRMAQEQ